MAGNIHGWSISRQGYMSMAMFGYALAKFANLRYEIRPDWSRYMRLDVRRAFEDSCEFLTGVAAGSIDIADEHSYDAHVSCMTADNVSDDSESLTALESQDDHSPEFHRDEQRERSQAIDIRTAYSNGKPDFSKWNLTHENLAGIDLTGSNLSDKGRQIHGATISVD